MFKNEQGRADGSAETVIGPSVKVEGDFVGQGDIIVEGILSGSITTAQHLTVGPNAKITADVTAQSATISGEISGKVTIKDHLDIQATGKIFGDVATSTASVEKGALLNGQMNMGGAKSQSSQEKKKEHSNQ